MTTMSNQTKQFKKWMDLTSMDLLFPVLKQNQKSKGQDVSSVEKMVILPVNALNKEEMEVIVVGEEEEAEEGEEKITSDPETIFVQEKTAETEMTSEERDRIQTLQDQARNLQ